MSPDLTEALRKAMRQQTESIAPLLAILRKQVAETSAIWRKYQ